MPNTVKLRSGFGTGKPPANALVGIARRLRDEVDTLTFGPPVTHVYNPLRYAWAPHVAYLELATDRPREVLFLGMNPGPYGMTQTGVPFGEVSLARDLLGVTGPVGQPPKVHPKRPIEGFACARSEVSGTRFWGWVQARFGSPAAFFERCFVMSYCPLVFMEASGLNRTPDKLPKAEREPLFEVCDRALIATLDQLRPALVIGIGGFAKARAEAVCKSRGVRVETILHPSPASPLANRGWAQAVDEQLRTMGFA